MGARFACPAFVPACSLAGGRLNVSGNKPLGRSFPGIPGSEGH